MDAILKLLPIVVTAVAAIIVLVSVLTAVIKGWRRATVGLFGAVLSFIAALLLTPSVSRAIGNAVIPMVKGMLANTDAAGLLSDLEQVGPAVADIITALPSALLAPIVFVLLYLLIRLITLIVSPLLTRLVFGEEAYGGQSGASRLVGLPIGALKGVVVALALLLPIICYVSILGGSVDRLLEALPEDSEYAETFSVVEQISDALQGDVFIKFAGATVGDSLTDSVMTLTVDGEEYTMSEFTETLTDAGASVVALTDMGKTGVNADTVAAIDSVIETVSKDGLVMKLVSEFVSSAGESWKNGDTFFGVEAPKASEELAPIMEELYNVCSNVNSETVAEDLGTIRDVLDISVKYGLIGGADDGETPEDPENPENPEDPETPDNSGSSNAVLDAVSKEGFLTEMITTLAQNERTAGLGDKVLDMSVDMISEKLNLDEDTANSIKDKLGKISEVEDVEGEAKKLEDAVQSALTLMESASNPEGGDALSSIDANTVQTLVDSFTKSEIFGGAADDIITSMLDSPMTGDAIDSSIYETIKENGGTENLGNVIESVQNTYDIVNELTSGEATDPEKIKDNIAWLAENMTSDTVAVVKSQLTDEKLAALNVPEDKRKVILNVVGTVLDKMAASGGMTHEQSVVEAEALAELYQLAMNLGKENNDAELMEDLDRIIAIVLKSEIVSETVVELSKTEDSLGVGDRFSKNTEFTAKLVALLDSNLKAAPSSKPERVVAIAKLFNINVTVNGTNVTLA